MELILEKLIPVVGSKGWKNPKNKNVKYFDALEGWKSNTSGGSSSTQNTIATVKSQGIELMSKYKFVILVKQ